MRRDPFSLVFFLLLFLVLVLAASSSAAAQTVIDPSKSMTFTFTPGNDYATKVGTTDVLTKFQLKFVVATDTGTSLLVIDCGKPALVGGSVVCVLPATQVAALVKNQILQAADVAVGPGGSALSLWSDGFFTLGAPAPGGKPSFTQP